MYSQNRITISKTRSLSHRLRIAGLKLVWGIRVLAEAVVRWDKVYRYLHFRERRNKLHQEFLSSQRTAPHSPQTHYLQGQMDILNELLNEPDGQQ